MKALDKESACFQYLCIGFFDEPHVWIMMNDPQFENSKMTIEKDAWFSFVTVTKNLLGNNKAANYMKFVENMLKAFQNLKCSMSIKVYFYLVT